MSAEEIQQALLREIGRILRQPPESIDVSRSLSELGMDSVGYVELAGFVRKKLDIPIQPDTLFELSSVKETAIYIAGLVQGPARAAQVDGEPQPQAVAKFPVPLTSYAEGDIAIIGASLRFPGARNLDELWALIARGEPVIREFPAERSPSGPGPSTAAPSYLKGGFIDDVDAFDAAFFGISPREAMAMDPQQRHLLECAWLAFEDAGYRTERLSGSNTAVFVGASSFDYYELLLQTQSARTTHMGTGISHAVLANRVSQYFNLKGASEAIDTACSSSLVALYRAIETLRKGESEIALVAGVNVLASRTPFQVFADAGMLSPDGLCLPFEDGAAGYVRGEGVGCVVVRRASLAARDGDRVLAVIKGGAVRHSGRTNSLTAPNPDAQADVMVAAFKDAQVDPASIGYIEAHGTGTALGDPIEVKGLKKAFSRLHGERGRTGVAPHFYVSSVKALTGHLEAAAGMAGLLKTVAVLAHRTIPGSPYLTRLNRHIDLTDAAFRVAREPRPWEVVEGEVSLPEGPRRAGVSSFGFGGVNAHVVLEEAPPSLGRSTARSQRHLFVLSARSAEALSAICTQLAKHLRNRALPDAAAEQVFLQDLAFTLRHARTPMSHRLAVIANSVAELMERLEQYGQQGADHADVLAGAGGDPSRVEANLFLYEAELAANLHEPLAHGELRKLAQLWTQGLAIDWEKILPRGDASLVTLPGYVFAQERFWPRFSSTEGASKPARPERSAPVFYAERWEAKPLIATAVSQPGSVIALVAGDGGRDLAEALKRFLPQRSVQLAVCPPEDLALHSAAADWAESVGELSTVLDLTPLDETLDRDSRQVLRKLELIRHLVGGPLKKGKSIELVQVTRGLHQLGGSGERPTSLAGALDSGFFKHLGAEYRRCRSKTVDLAPSGLESAEAAALLARELEQHDGESELAWREGQRFARVMERVSPPALKEAEEEQGGVAFITGGTGDIGLRLARDLVHRGFKALLLAGRRTPSPEKQALIDELEQQGAAIGFYRGELTDELALREALGTFRGSHGRITHVFHCAGAVDLQTPAFLQKTAESMAAVMRPKADALPLLHELFVHEPPQAFVLFSSVSAVAPRLAAGVLDYSAANRFLDLFAQFQYAAGHRYYRSIQWTRWRGIGLARGAQESADGYGQPLDADQCLEALNQILTAGDALGPSVCVLAEGDRSLVQPLASEEPPQAAAALPKPETKPDDLEGIRRKLRSIVAKELETDESKLNDEARFEDLGIDSIVLTGLVSQIEAWIGCKVNPATLIRCDSILAMARYLANLAPVTPAPAEPPVTAAQPRCNHGGSFRVAVIGMACRFPGAGDKEAFWRNLAAGVDSVTEVPSSRWKPTKPIAQWGGFVEGIERICPKLFGLSEKDAADVDPLVRLFTECGLDAVLDSPYDRDALKGRRVGVFAGARVSGYANRIAAPGKHSVTGVGQNFVSAYLSHVLHLRGPSLVIDSACSSSLAAIHLACQSLQSGDSELALAGGVEVLLDEKAYHFLSEARALSADGRCRTFDEKADGFVPGEGVGCVLLKPLDQALADEDPIYAVIDGSAMNNDGHTLGITTPGVEGQVDVIVRALQKAGVSPKEISYVEAHGTGTMIGDPIELNALARAFVQDPPKRCALGSVKTNIGHLLSAAGVASFIKVALSLRHGTLPPTLHCETINPRFEFDRTPFFPLRQLQPWEAGGGLRRAGISSFGFGKTNVHVVLSEKPEGARTPQVLEACRCAVPDSEKVHAWHPAERVQPLREEPAEPALLALEDMTYDDQAREAGDVDQAL